MSTSQKFLNAMVVMSLVGPGIAIITTTNPYWRIPLAVFPALMALNMKKQLTSLDAPVFSVPLVFLTVLSFIYIYFDKKTGESIKNGEKKRTLILFGVYLTLFAMMAIGLGNVFSPNSSMGLGGSSFQPSAPSF